MLQSFLIVAFRKKRHIHICHRIFKKTRALPQHWERARATAEWDTMIKRLLALGVAVALIHRQGHQIWVVLVAPLPAMDRALQPDTRRQAAAVHLLQGDRSSATKTHSYMSSNPYTTKLSYRPWSPRQTTSCPDPWSSPTTAILIYRRRCGNQGHARGIYHRRHRKKNDPAHDVVVSIAANQIHFRVFLLISLFPLKESFGTWKK